jgi:hypothetical protein
MAVNLSALLSGRPLSPRKIPRNIDRFLPSFSQFIFYEHSTLRNLCSYKNVVEQSSNLPVDQPILLATCSKPGSCLAYSSTLKMEATYSSETSFDFERTIRRYIPGERILYNHRFGIPSPTINKIKNINIQLLLYKIREMK